MNMNFSKTEIAILMEHGYTESEALESLNMGTIVSDELEEIALLYGVTVDEMREGIVEDLSIVKHDGIEYAIGICHG